MPYHIGNDMHDMAIALNLHELCDPNGTAFCNAADVIPRQVHEHDVFGPFFWIAQQLSGVGFVFFWSQTPGASSCDWPNLQDLVSDPDMHLRRTTNE